MLQCIILKYARKRKINAKSKQNKQTNSVRKRKEIKKNTYTCRILSMSNNDATFTKKNKENLRKICISVRV